MPEYVDFDRAKAKEIWADVNVKLSEFTPLKVLRDGMAIVARVDLDVLYEITEECAVNFLVAGCEIQVDPEEGSMHLQGGLNISPELRAILTIMVSRKLSGEISQAIKECADWIEATAGAPDGFIGNEFPESGESETSEDEEAPVSAVVTPPTEEDEAPHDPANPY